MIAKALLSIKMWKLAAQQATLSLDLVSILRLQGGPPQKPVFWFLRQNDGRHVGLIRNLKWKRIKVKITICTLKDHYCQITKCNIQFLTSKQLQTGSWQNHWMAPFPSGWWILRPQVFHVGSRDPLFQWPLERSNSIELSEKQCTGSWAGSHHPGTCCQVQSQKTNWFHEWNGRNSSFKVWISKLLDHPCLGFVSKIIVGHAALSDAMLWCTLANEVGNRNCSLALPSDRHNQVWIFVDQEWNLKTALTLGHSCWLFLKSTKIEAKNFPSIQGNISITCVHQEKLPRLRDVDKNLLIDQGSCAGQYFMVALKVRFGQNTIWWENEILHCINRHLSLLELWLTSSPSIASHNAFHHIRWRAPTCSSSSNLNCKSRAPLLIPIIHFLLAFVERCDHGWIVAIKLVKNQRWNPKKILIRSWLKPSRGENLKVNLGN